MRARSRDEYMPGTNFRISAQSEEGWGKWMNELWVTLNGSYNQWE